MYSGAGVESVSDKRMKAMWIKKKSLQSPCRADPFPRELKAFLSVPSYLPDWGDAAVNRLHHLTRPCNCCAYTWVVLSATLGKENGFFMAEKARETPKTYLPKQFFCWLLGPESMVAWDPNPTTLYSTHSPNAQSSRHWEVLHKEVSQTVWPQRYFPLYAFLNKLKMNSIMIWRIICPQVLSLLSLTGTLHLVYGRENIQHVSCW